MASVVPADLKPIAPYLARAHELATADPPMSYWCNYFAVQLAMTLGSQDSESNAFLFALMDKLEVMKAELSTNDAVTDDAAAAAYVENFALKIFGQADKEDRAGKATRLTAKKFLAAANFLDLLSVFGDISVENRDKVKYSKWKAADIAKAFREGRTPVPGPAGGLPTSPSELAATGDPDEVLPSEVNDLTRELASLESSAPPSEPDAYPFPQNPTTLPSSSDADPDGEEPVTPAFPSFLNTPTALPPSPPPLPVEFPSPILPTHQTSVLPPPTGSTTSSFPAAVFPSAPPFLPPPAPTYTPSPPPPVSQPRYVAPAPPAPAPVPAPMPTAPHADVYDPSVVAQIQKHAKWAVSALNYDDYETARKELRLALAMLGG
ncbi:hypothetical protein RQP46_009586 [Phenoliferia psychrophenolica]